MNLYQRVVTLQGPQDDVAAWAIEITGLVNDKSNLDVSLWQVAFGAPLGTMVWSAQVDGLPDVEDAFMTLGSDKSYLKLVEKAGDWVTTPGEDRLVRVQHVAGGDYARPDVGSYAEGTVAVPAEGKLAEAVQWGIEISDLHAEITHQSVLFGTNAYGEFGEVGWLGLSPDAAAIDRAAEATGTDERYVKSLDSAGNLFRPGSAQRTLARRIV
jgi:hypothetical protein